MNETLKKIDADLIDLEERVLAELRRLRKLESTDTYSLIEPGLHEELKLVYTELLKFLEGTADWSNLSLKSDEQEWIEGRMKVVRNILVRKLPTAFLAASHQEHKAARNGEFGTDAHFASEELAILDVQMARHHIDGRSIEEVIKERAQFSSRELSKGHAQELSGSRRQIAQSPDEIRKKLQGSTGSRGPSTFLSRDLGGSQPQPIDKAKPTVEKRDIAQSPEEIRRKLAARQGTATGKATFGARDIGSVNDSLPKPRPADTPPPTKATPPPARGKAIFGARDIEHISERAPQQQVQQAKTEKKPAPGRATFESRDLSDPKP